MNFIVLSLSQKLCWIINLDKDVRRYVLNSNLVNLASQWCSWRGHSDLVEDDKADRPGAMFDGNKRFFKNGKIQVVSINEKMKF